MDEKKEDPNPEVVGDVGGEEIIPCERDPGGLRFVEEVGKRI